MPVISIENGKPTWMMCLMKISELEVNQSMILNARVNNECNSKKLLNFDVLK